MCPRPVEYAFLFFIFKLNENNAIEKMLNRENKPLNMDNGTRCEH